MQIQKIIFINRAPFGNLTLDFEAHGINVLSAINGKGKTTVLSQIVDAFHEMGKVAFSNSYSEKFEGKYYRVLTSRYSINQEKPALVYIRFIHDGEYFDYIELIGKIDEQYYNQIDIEDKIPLNKVFKELSDSSSAKILSSNCKSKQINSIFTTSILTYFPAYRFEVPGFMNDIYSDKLLYDISAKYSGYLPNPIEVVSDLPRLANWLMDVVLDDALYKSQGSRQLWHALNTVLSLTIKPKAKRDIRLGIGPRNNTSSRISVVYQDNGATLYPSIFEISSGEAALLCIFGEILRQSDQIGQTFNSEGIVLIDEIDKHLHITLQYSILPQLFNLFPRIQFIVSSHSPFLTMGLSEMQYNRTKLIDLDNNGLVTFPRNTELYKSVYELFVNENNNFARELSIITSKIEEQTKPIIITEGKTDIKHILKAQEMLSITDLDYACIEIDNQPDGDMNLIALLEQLAKVKRANSIIGIFDRDNDKILKALNTNESEFHAFGNNVYGFCIPVPEMRKQNGQIKISIEYLYSDEEIKTFLPNGCRLFLGTEFTKKSMWHNTEQLTLKLPKGKGEDKILENNGGQAVFDSDDNNYLAKKDDFAEAISKGQVDISKDSWTNFHPIFNIIRKIKEL